MRLDIDFDDEFGNNYVASVKDFQSAHDFIEFLDSIFYECKSPKKVNMDLLKECER